MLFNVFPHFFASSIAVELHTFHFKRHVFSFL